MYHDWMWGWGWGWFPWVIVLIIWLIVRSNRGRNYYSPPPPSQESPLDILKKRYAKGEITKEQFDQMRKDLE